MENTKNNEFNGFEVGLYSIYDTVLHKYDVPFFVNKQKIDDYMNIIVNDVQSRYFNHEVDYVLFYHGDFNLNNAEFYFEPPKKISSLDTYIDKRRRDLQTVVQTLNFIPTGYFKMPAEQKNAIQDRINETIQKYCIDYVIPDLDMQTIVNQKVQSSNIQNPRPVGDETDIDTSVNNATSSYHSIKYND